MSDFRSESTGFLGVDFDGVIANTPEYKAFYLESLGVENLGDNEYGQVMRKMYNDIEMSVERLKFNIGAVDSLTLLKTKYVVKVVTMRDEVSVQTPEILLAQVGLEDIPIIATRQESKLPFVEKNCFAFIDDDPRVLVEMLGTVPLLYLMETEKNKDFTPNGIIRVHSWAEFVDHLLANAPNPEP